MQTMKPRAGSSEHRTLGDCAGRVPTKPVLAAQKEEARLFYNFQAADFMHFRQHYQVSDIYSVSPVGSYGTFLTDGIHLLKTIMATSLERERSQQEKCFPCTSRSCKCHCSL